MLFASMIKETLERLKPLGVSPINDKLIYHFLHEQCYKIHIQFRSDDPNKIETDRFFLFGDEKCPHNKTSRSACSNCSNFIIHEFELRHGRKLFPSTSISIGYCAKRGYRT